MPRHPIVLCHGLFGFDKLFGQDYWPQIPEAFLKMGAECFVARVDATSAVETRAEQLMQQINRKYPGGSVHLIGHSMGGLDCRYLVTHLLHRASFNVLSVTTVSTPHRGSPVADAVLATHSKHSVPSHLGTACFGPIFMLTSVSWRPCNSSGPALLPRLDQLVPVRRWRWAGI